MNMMRVASKVAPKNIGYIIRKLVENGEVASALDIGCGTASAISSFRPELRTIGADASPAVIAAGSEQNSHDELVLADVSTDDGRERLRALGPVDLVTMVHSIEHLPRDQGLVALRLCEELTSKYVIVETPNGFLPQGPEYGNPFQCHLSGWFPHDFQARGYSVYGTYGTRWTYGYAGVPRWNVRGAETFDLALAKLVSVERHPERAFAIIAMKDVRGVDARLP